MRCFRTLCPRRSLRSSRSGAPAEGVAFFVQNRSYREPPIRSRHSELGTRFSQTGKSQPLTRPVYPSGGHRMYLLGTFFGLYGWFLGGVVTRAAPPRDCRLIGHVPLFKQVVGLQTAPLPRGPLPKKLEDQSFFCPNGPSPLELRRPARPPV
jgi:hypothetical protein